MVSGVDQVDYNFNLVRPDDNPKVDFQPILAIRTLEPMARKKRTKDPNEGIQLSLFEEPSESSKLTPHNQPIDPEILEQHLRIARAH